MGVLGRTRGSPRKAPSSIRCPEVLGRLDSNGEGGRPSDGMRVALVDSWFHWPPVGGAVRSVKEIADGLAKRGIDTTVVAPAHEVRGGEDFAFRIDGIRLGRVNGPLLYSAIRRRLRKLSPDAVIVTGGNMLKPYLIEAARGFPVLVRLYAYELRCPASYGILFRDGRVCENNFLKRPTTCVTCTEDIRRIYYKLSPVDRTESLGSLKFVYPLYYALVRRAVRSITMAVATSDYMKSQFEGVIPLDRVRVIPDGVDPDFFVPGEKGERSIKVVTLPGRTSDPLKGLDVFLRACASLWRRRQDFRVVVTGSNRPGIMDYPFVQSDLWLDDKDIPGMYANSDIVVVPSIWGEPFGLTALEAMSCEVPVVASRVGGLQEIVHDGENGLLFSPGDHVELAGRIERLLDDSGLRARLGRQGRRYVVEKFTWGPIVERYASILGDIARPGPGRGGG